MGNVTLGKNTSTAEVSKDKNKWEKVKSFKDLIAKILKSFISQLLLLILESPVQTPGIH